MKTKMNSLFIYARDYFHPPTLVQYLIIRYLNREYATVHLACSSGRDNDKSASLKAFETIPNLHLCPTKFGPTATGRSKRDVARSLIFTGFPSTVSLVGLAQYIKRHKIDVIYAEQRPIDAFYSLLLAKLAGIKLVVHIHSPYGDWLGWRVRWAMKHADALIVVSQFIAQSIIAAGYPPEKVHCVLNGIDVSLWNCDADRNLVREEFGLTPEVPLLAIVARLVPYKGHKLLLEALALVRDQVPDIKLLIVGGENPPAGGSGLYGPVLRQMISKLNLDEHVVFTGLRSDIQNILAASDIFTLPSDGEPCALSFIEAMAMKKPVIGLNSGGAPEIVEHEKSGLLSSPGDVQQLATNIVTLVNDPALRRRMGEYGRMRVEQYFNSQRMADDTEQVFRHILGYAQVPNRQSEASRVGVRLKIFED